jgi:toxin-antitoxin system PIN domain toxin
VSVTVDANVLVYASNVADPLHETALELMGQLAAGPTLVYLFWPVTMGYLRIVTHPGVLPAPLSPEDAIANVSALLERPHVRVPGEANGFWAHFCSTARDDTAGNHVPDAHIAALMRQHDVATIYTRDRDFRRFDGIEMRNPFA